MNLEEYLEYIGLNVNPVRGWESRRSSSKGFAPVGIMWHHTAGRNSLQYIIDRALCQFHISKSGVVSLISNDRTGHPGIGSGVVLRETQQGIAPYAKARDRRLKDDTYGYKFYYGIEVENMGDGKDPYPEAQIEALLLLSAALCELKGWGPEVVIHHHEWTKRKVDMSIDSFFGMSTLEAVRYTIAQVRDIPYTPPTPFEYPDIEELTGLTYRFDRVLGQGDESDVNGDVWLFQEFLVEMGQDIKVDGDFGPASRRATQAVQRVLDINDDGLWGDLSASATDRFFAQLHAIEKKELANKAELDRVAAAKLVEEEATLEAAEAEAAAVDDAQEAAIAALEAEELADVVNEGARAEEREIALENIEAEVDLMDEKTFENPPAANEGDRLTREEVSFLRRLIRAIFGFKPTRR